MAQKKENFWSRYSKLCLKNKVYPSRSVIKNFRSSELSCIVEAIRCEHWKFILPALCNDNSLSAVHFASCVSPHEDDCSKSKKNKRNRTFPTPYGRSEKNINTITLSLTGLLHSSQTLTMLKLENLSIKILDAEQLSLGLSKSCYLKSFSLGGCCFEEGAVPVICRGLNRSSVSWVDFSDCDLRQPDFEALSYVIKAHNTRRSNQMFPNTLRYQVPRFQELPGLNRISLNFNCIDDSSMNTLIMSIMNDYWIKAIDLQHCGIDDDVADALIVLATNNPAITLIDVRLNGIDPRLREKLDEQLTLNRSGKDIKFTELSLWKPSELVRKYNAIGKVKGIRKTSVHKLKTAKKIPKSLNVSVKLLQSIQDKSTIMKNASVQTESPPVKPKEYALFLNSVKIKLANEVQLRKFYVSKFNEAKDENARLREMLKSQNDDIHIDQETFFDIKHTFEKLKIFFDVMKKYGLWEYISMLGFDESTDVIIEENDSGKGLKVTRKDTFFQQENTMEPDGEVCCNCRKADSRCKNTESSCDSSDGVPNCNSASNIKTLHNKNKAIKEDPMNERVAYRLLQEVMNDYNNVSSHQALNAKPTAIRMPDVVDVPDDGTRPSSSKQSGSTSPKAASGAHMLIKKFSYSNMPKQLKELVSPADFYNIVKKELERCENEARKPSSSQTDNSTPQTIGSIHFKQSVYKVANHKNEANSISTSRESREIPAKLPRKASIEEEFENMTISELIARERAAKQALSKKDSSAKSSVSLMSSSKIHKNTNHAKIKETKSMVKSEQLFTKSKLNLSVLSNCSQNSSKKLLSRSNVSSDEINSSDSVVTASDKLSHSSVSSSSSNKSHGGKSSDYSEPQKSYIESVSDASTYKDVESISDIEIASQVYSPGVSEKQESASKDNKNSSSKAFKNGSASSQSTLKGVSKPNESVASGSSSASKKGDKPSQGKTRNANKHNKNRPKSSSSKSSSVPSLSDITTVSSQNLNTDSVMQQISASEEKSKGEK